MIIICKIAYLGKNYFGWQKQNGQITVQQTLEEGLTILLNRKVDITGCGRTDTGVHANNYIFHFNAKESDVDRLSIHNVNGILPIDIAILELYYTTDKFHARFDAYHRKYIYRIHTRKNVFQNDLSYYYNNFFKIDLQKFILLDDLILSTLNFKSFTKFHSNVDNFDCKISESCWKQISDTEFEYHISANRFLRGMVRLIVGTYINYGLDKINMHLIKDDISNLDQISKAWSVAAHGLTLVEVKYPDDLMKSWVQFGI